MNWLLAGIIPPILWSIVNHSDKYLLSRVAHKSSVGLLMVYSTLFSIVVLPVVLLFSHDQLFVDWGQVILQLVGGVLLTLSIYFYLMALNKDEASIVVPLALLVPIFGYIFSFFLLGETLSFEQLTYCFLIIFGALILSLEFNEERKIRIKHGVLFFMILCSAFQAAQETLFKFVTIQNSFATSIFWLHLGIMICGIFLIFSQPGLFKEFVTSFKLNGKLIFGVNFVSEAVSSIAYIIRDYATLLAPIAIIMTLNGYQPVSVFILGIILTILFPKFVTEKIKLTHLIHKSVAIIIMVAGTILITQTI